MTNSDITNEPNLQLQFCAEKQNVETKEVTRASFWDFHGSDYEKCCLLGMWLHTVCRNLLMVWEKFTSIFKVVSALKIQAAGWSEMSVNFHQTVVSQSRRWYLSQHTTFSTNINFHKLHKCRNNPTKVT